MSGFPNLTDLLGSNTVDRANLINAQLQSIDTGLTGLSSASGITTPPLSASTVGPGGEWVNEDGLYKWSNGSAWSDPLEETWGSWTTITLTAPFTARPGFTPALRVSSLKNVQMRGVVNADSSGNAWPTTGFQLISSGQFVGTNLPEVTEIFPGATGIVATNQANSYIYLTVTTAPASLAIYALYQGTRNAAGVANNFITLDNVRYKAA